MEGVPLDPLCHIVGRETELSEIQSMLVDDRDDTRPFLITGPSGIGKTLLLDVAAAKAAQENFDVVRGTCLDIGNAWPLHPLLGTLSNFTPAQLPPSPRSPNIDAPSVLSHAHNALSSIAENGQILVVIDDLQWADDTTLQLVRTLMSSITSSAIKLIGAFRTDTDPGPQSLKLIEDFYRSDLSHVIELTSLDETATAKLARRTASVPLSNNSAHQIWLRSGGIPVLVIDLARHAFAGHVADPGKALAHLRFRVENLPQNVRSFVRLISLGIGLFPHNLAKSVLELEDDETLDAARSAIAAGILRARDEGYEFVHDLFRQAAQDTLLAPEQLILHRRIAQALEADRSVNADPIELAHHWHGAGEKVLALEPFIAAAQRASQQGAPREAWNHWKVATDILKEGPAKSETAELFACAAEAAHAVDQNDAALKLIKLAKESTEIQIGPDTNDTTVTSADWARRVRLELVHSRYLASSGMLDEALNTCNQTLNNPNIAPSSLNEMGAFSAEILSRLGRYHEASSLASTVLARKQPHAGVNTTFLLASAVLAYGQAYLGDTAAGRNGLETALRQATATADPELVAVASHHYAELLLGPLNQLNEGVLFAQKQAAMLQSEEADPKYITPLFALASTGLFRLGRWLEAVDAATVALEIDPTGPGTIDLLLSRVRVVLGLGNFVSAERDLNSIELLVGQERNPRQYLPYATLRAGLALWQQEPENARREVASALEVADETSYGDSWSIAPVIWHGLRAEAALKERGLVPDIKRSEYLYKKLQEIVTKTRSTNPNETDPLRAYLHLCRGELDKVLDREDPTPWAHAAQTWDRCGHLYPAAYARLQNAKLQFGSRTQNQQAAKILKHAHIQASKLEARPLLTEIESLAKLAKVTTSIAEPSSSSTDNPYTGLLSLLTPRELDVISELSQGKSNREIGEELFISRSTVGVHVSNILTKLNVKSRVEAATLFATQTES